jgi:hypothetical protein
MDISASLKENIFFPPRDETASGSGAFRPHRRYAVIPS